MGRVGFEPTTTELWERWGLLCSTNDRKPNNHQSIPDRALTGQAVADSEFRPDLRYLMTTDVVTVEKAQLDTDTG